MLQIKEIKKQYITGDLVQTALDGVSLNLRDNEFVAILGPSGSGKTTLLNVIGGLDRYDSGDLIINGISTKKYTDRDWDSYRNHTIGFVFQSYNLIPHQSVLANVELALTISGISRAERRKRAKKALEDVGLGNQLHKRPNQMSGGQMQRVAIARALVNNPDILLADEPTGALDSETSVQIMNLLKEVAKDRLVVMVTHNPELAEEYANRIVRVKDGRIIDDTNEFAVNAAAMEPPKHKNMGKASMSYFTALSLSFNNLRTKLGRTLLTAFAGSIGIIGIALIMSLSTGFQKYIDKIQADTLSNYPLTIQTETADMTSMMAAFGTSIQASQEADDGVLVEQQMITQMFAQIGANDLAAFKTYLEENYDQIGHTVSTVKNSYNIKPRIYNANMDNGILQSNPATLFEKLMGNSLMSAYMMTDVFYEMIDNRELLDSQYQVLQGRWPENDFEMVAVLSGPHQLTDYVAYTVGLKDPDILKEMMSKVMRGETYDEVDGSLQWTYDDLMALRFKLVSVPDLYRLNEEYQVWEDMSGDMAYMEEVINQGEDLQIVGIVCPREGVSATTLSEGIAYTSGLTRHVVSLVEDEEIVKSQLENPDINVFTGKGFDEETGTDLDFENLVTVDQNAITSAFGMNISEDSLMNVLKSYLEDVMSAIKVDTTPARDDFISTLSKLGEGMLRSFIAANADASGSAKLYLTDAQDIVAAYMASEEALKIVEDLADQYSLPSDSLTLVYRPLLVGMITGYVAEELSGEQIPPETSSHTQNAEEPETEQIVEEATTEEAVVEEIAQTSEIALVAEILPVETQPVETQPAETQPAETQPAETQPAETQPAETQPAETQPAETQPAETQPAETQPAETQPAETQPAETQPAETQPAETQPVETQPTETEPQETLPDVELPTIPPSEEPEVNIDINQFYASITADQVSGVVDHYCSNSVVVGTAAAMSTPMMRTIVKNALNAQLGSFGNKVASFIGSSFTVDGQKIASAFQFNMNEEDLQRLMMAMSGQSKEVSATVNLQTLGYADLDVPTMMSIYLLDFAAKEEFMEFLDAYNAQMEAEEKEEQVIRYTDVTGIMMSSVRTIIDSVSYALIAFVAVSLVVSSIMIGIITYISVMERTKEIGVLRAIGASKHNITQVFNAETFIIGLCSGMIGIGVTLLILIPGNMLIQHLTNNPDIVAQLPVMNALILIGLSVILTLIGGFIPAKKAAKKDPVIALRSE